MSDKLLIWGAGAIGGTIGAHLARAGHDVLLVDTETEHVAAMRARGLTIEGPVANFTQQVSAGMPDDLTGRFNRILLCVKAHHTEAAARQLAPHLARGGYVASFQNGLNEFVIGNVVGLPNVVGAFINFGADYLEPGRILFGGRGACVLGELDGAITQRLAALHAVLTAFEPDAITTDNILGYLWGKLGYGALLFATALTDDFDRRRARRRRQPRRADARRARGDAGGGCQAHRAAGIQRLRPRRIRARQQCRIGRRRDGCDGRVQPQIRQIAQRHLARSGDPKASHRGRCPARPGGGGRRRARGADAMQCAADRDDP